MADVAQLVEHTVVARVVESSILFIRPIQEKTPRTLYEAFFVPSDQRVKSTLYKKSSMMMSLLRRIIIFPSQHCGGLFFRSPKTEPEKAR